VAQTEAFTFPELQAEVARLREELQTRDQLVQQLSQELFRLVKGNASAPTAAEVPERQAAELRALREQLQGVEQQVTFYQAQLADRESEAVQLRQSVQELGDRSKMLEKVVQEMPHIYREKFDRRLAPIKEKVSLIQRENRQLHAELQSVSYRLAVRSRRTNQLDLPTFPHGGAALPSLG
jgi:chromosome segregation ATPase